MKKHLLYIILIIFHIIILRAETETEITEKLPLIQNVNNSGTEFYFTIPPAYDERPSHASVKLFITTNIKTNVKVEVKSRQFKVEQQTIPNGVISINIPIDTAMPFKHLPASGQGMDAKVFEDAGISVKSDDPITVYVIFNSYQVSEGFLAMPLECMGKEYIVANYNDMGWNGSLFYPPFAAITAVYDNTTFEIKLGGNASSNFRDQDGKLINPGQKFKLFKLDKGDVFVFSSNGPYQDITGSKINADKPFSLVTAHYCMNVPLQNQWCNYAIEMQSPTTTWGKTHLIPKYTPRRVKTVLFYLHILHTHIDNIKDCVSVICDVFIINKMV